MQTILIDQGLDLMLFGMGTVFSFLFLLVMATKAMSALVNRWLPDALVSDDSVESKALLTGSAVDPRVAKVIQAAIDRHRKSV